jgi:hexosaminidase
MCVFFLAPEIIFYVPEQRLVHFDLKGAPPKMDYLLRMLKWVKDAGATGVLLEYEEMFPFSGRLEAVAASNHYNVSDITNIVNTCQQVMASNYGLKCVHHL